MRCFRMLVGLTAAGVLLMFCACLQKGVVPGPKPGGDLFARAENQYNQGLYNSAVNFYQDYLDQFPNGKDAPAALHRIGDVFSLRGDYADARRQYGRLIERFPKSSFAEGARIGILHSWYKEEQYQRVLDYAASINDQRMSDDNLVRKYAVVSDAYLALGEPVDAAYVLISALKKVAEGAQKKILIKLNQVSGRIGAEALQKLLADVGEPGFRGYLSCQIANRYIQKEDYEQAVIVLSDFIDAYPDDAYTVTAAEMMRQIEQKAVYDFYAIGCLLPLTGEYRLFGERALKGIQLAFQEFVAANSRGGTIPPIKLIIGDTGSNPGQAVAAVKELADKKVAAIIGPLGSFTDAIREAENRHIPIIALSQEQDIPALGKYVFRNFLTPQMQVDSLTTYACRTLGLRKFAVLYPDEEYGRVFAHKFWDEILKYGGEMVGFESYSPTATDFADSIKKLAGSRYTTVKKRQLDFEALFIPDGPSSAGLVLPQLAFHDVVGTFLLGTNLWYSRDLIETTGRYAQGAVMPADFWEAGDPGTEQSFSFRYERFYNEKPGFVSAVAYDTALILMNIINAPDVRYRHSIIDRLQNIAGYPGVTGITSFDESGEVRKALTLLKIRGSQFVKVQEADAGFGDEQAFLPEE